MRKMNEKERQHELYMKRKKPTWRRCAICGGLLDHGNQTYCLNCLLDNYVNGEREERDHAYHCLTSRGYSTQEALREAQRRGLIKPDLKRRCAPISNTNLKGISTILEHYGAEPQKAKLCEELRELEEAAHDDLCAKSPETRAHFIEELADVSIMVEQAKLALTPEEEKEFHETITFKVQRQLGRIERGE